MSYYQPFKLLLYMYIILKYTYKKYRLQFFFDVIDFCWLFKKSRAEKSWFSECFRAYINVTNTYVPKFSFPMHSTLTQIFLAYQTLKYIWNLDLFLFPNKTLNSFQEI